LKLELIGDLRFNRTYKTMLFHWGSSATKNRSDGEAQTFRQSETPAAQLFNYKWGFVPIPGNNRLNSKLPTENNIVKGINFR
jgi:hypothetical protein